MSKYNLWTTTVEVLDNFIEDQDLICRLKAEAVIGDTVQGQNKQGLTDAQQQMLSIVTSAIINYCVDCNVDYNSLKFANLQKGCLKKYDHTMVSNHLYEPHHDIAEGSFITALYYVDSDWSNSMWVGGELTLYKHMTFVDYPENIINILPKQNRLIIFPGFITHRVKPYFGDTPRTSLVFGWSVEHPVFREALVI